MSNYTRIKTQLIDKECIIEALQNMGFTVQELRRGQQLAIQDLGFTLTRNTRQNTYDLVTGRRSTRNLPRSTRNFPGQTLQQFIQTLNREYATLKVVREVTKKGYHVQKKRVKATGEVKLIAVKRVWA